MPSFLLQKAFDTVGVNALSSPVSLHDEWACRMLHYIVLAIFKDDRLQSSISSQVVPL